MKTFLRRHSCSDEILPLAATVSLLGRDDGCRGFTLIEIVVALFIFAILGTITAIGLRAVIKTHQRVEQVDKHLQKLQIAMTLMRRDISQFVDRPVASTSGESLPSLLIKNTSDFALTTGGYANPFSATKRSTLQRVAYQLKDHKLIRITWPALDRPPHITPLQRILLTHVTSMSLSFINDKGQTINVWAPGTIQNSTVQPGTLPRAIIITLTLQHQGKLRSVFPIVGRGFNAQ